MEIKEKIKNENENVTKAITEKSKREFKKTNLIKIKIRLITCNLDFNNVIYIWKNAQQRLECKIT